MMAEALVTLIINDWVCVPADARTHYTCTRGNQQQIVETDPRCIQRGWVYNQRYEQVRIECRSYCHE